MKALLTRIFQAAFPPAAPAIEPQPRTAGGKRKLKTAGKRRHPAPKGARRIDPNGSIIQQARGEQ
ncbi:hypothetical protein [Burkholderia multivorans]|uniref:hypothetical protein n=1 Tax=Burkholderia multivorans TaxID=87883 RepID=UPI000D003E17|nr:hypothetical protein [Burkholderia multivorans]PRG51352.1 hypothetical protein C6T62_00040 [Burkholderia multivorans]